MVKHRQGIPLAFTLFAVFFFWMLVVIASPFVLTFFGLQSAINEDVALGILGIVLAVCVYLIIVRVCVRPIHAILDWLQTSRANNFERVEPLAISSSDEIGQLAREVSASVSLIWELRKREQELLKHKGDTITLIEHQLRTALTSLKWMIESVEVPQEVRAAVARVSDTVQEIINAARIGEGTFGYVFADLDIVPLVESLVSRLKTRADSRGVTLAFEHEENAPHIKADTDRLGIAILNILSNAVEYTPQGGTVTVSVTTTDHLLDVSVKDTGIGMSQEDIANLFTKMHRGAGAMKMRPDGSGLGLYVARNILDEHHAEILIRSEEGRGTQVSFRIPVAG